MAIAEHHPGEVSDKNRGVLKMSHSQLHDFADTKEKGLPAHKQHPTRNLGKFAHPKKGRRPDTESYSYGK